MRLGTILSLGASVLLGIGALFAARLLMPGEQKAQEPVRTVPVVTARAAIPYGVKLDASHLTVARLPADAAPEGAYSTVGQVIALDNGAPVTLLPIAAREPLLGSKVSGGGGKASMASTISPGMRAYTIKVTDSAGVGGHALPGDRVDVVLAREIPAGENKTRIVADVVLQNVRLLGLNLNADPDSTDKSTPKTATLEVSVDDAGRLSVASGIGLLSLALRGAGSAEIEPVGAVAASQLGGKGAGA